MSKKKSDKNIASKLIRQLLNDRPKRISFHYLGKPIFKLKLNRTYFDELVVVDLERAIELGIIKPVKEKDNDNK